MGARADSEHQLALDADPHPGPAPDMLEAEYEILSVAARDEF